MIVGHCTYFTGIWSRTIGLKSFLLIAFLKTNSSLEMPYKPPSTPGLRRGATPLRQADQQGIRGVLPSHIPVIVPAGREHIRARGTSRISGNGRPVHALTGADSPSTRRRTLTAPFGTLNIVLVVNFLSIIMSLASIYPRILLSVPSL